MILNIQNWVEETKDRTKWGKKFERSPKFCIGYSIRDTENFYCFIFFFHLIPQYEIKNKISFARKVLLTQSFRMSTQIIFFIILFYHDLY